MEIHNTWEEIIDFAEDLLVFIFTGLRERCKYWMDVIQREYPDAGNFQIPSGKAPRIRFADGIKMLREVGIEASENEDIRQASLQTPILVRNADVKQHNERKNPRPPRPRKAPHRLLLLNPLPRCRPPLLHSPRPHRPDPNALVRRLHAWPRNRIRRAADPRRHHAGGTHARHGPAARPHLAGLRALCRRVPDGVCATRRRRVRAQPHHDAVAGAGEHPAGHAVSERSAEEGAVGGDAGRKMRRAGRRKIGSFFGATVAR